MTESQLASLVLRSVDRTGAWPERLVAHPTTILGLVREHTLMPDAPRNVPASVSVCGVPVIADASVRRGTVAFRPPMA